MASDFGKPTVFGRSLRLADGDLAFEQGDLAIVRGRENFLQSIRVIVETPAGSDVFNVNYGFDLAGILQAATSVRHTKELIRLNIVKSVSQDSRVREIKEIVFSDEDRFADLVPGLADGARPSARMREWHAVVIVETISEGEVALRLEGTGLRR